MGTWVTYYDNENDQTIELMPLGEDMTYANSVVACQERSATLVSLDTTPDSTSGRLIQSLFETGSFDKYVFHKVLLTFFC